MTRMEMRRTRGLVEVPSQAAEQCFRGPGINMRVQERNPEGNSKDEFDEEK